MSLPREILVKIFFELTREQLHVAQNVCVQWNNLITDILAQPNLRKKIEGRIRNNKPLEKKMKTVDFHVESLQITAGSGANVLMRTQNETSLTDSEVFLVNVSANSDNVWTVSFLSNSEIKTCKDNFSVTLNNKFICFKGNPHKK